MVLDITGIDIAALAGFVGSMGTAIASVLKAKQADRRSSEIEVAREQSKKDRDREIEALKSEVKLLQHENKEVRERLSEGNGHFVRLESEVKETNGLLREIIGALNNKGLIISGSPKVARDSRLEL